MDETTNLATEILKELKTTNKRMFAALCISMAINIAVVAGFLWYISLPVDMENVTVESTASGHANFVDGDMSGVINNGKDYGNEVSESDEEPETIQHQ